MKKKEETAGVNRTLIRSEPERRWEERKRETIHILKGKGLAPQFFLNLEPERRREERERERRKTGRANARSGPTEI